MARRATEKELNRQLELATESISPENIAKELAIFAKLSLRDVISSGEGSDRYERYVNGNLDAPEESVVPPGPIVYLFHWWPEVIEYALQVLVDRSPEKSGRYKRSWFVMVNGTIVNDYTQIPIGAQVMLTNDQPYSRKIEVGHMRMSVEPGVVQDSRRTVMSRFGNTVEVKATMITLPGSYVLKGMFRRGFRRTARPKLRKDTQAGAQMTYPALSLVMR
jgi:hypothetical protein